MSDQLFPRAPRRMKQPRKALLRDALTAITEENIRLRAEVEFLRKPWLLRLIRRKRG